MENKKTVAINIRVTLDEGVVKKCLEFMTLPQLKGIIADQGKKHLEEIAHEDEIYFEKCLK